MATTPTFTLVGETSGGPPTTYTWTRDGVEITNSSSDSISLSLNTVPMEPDTPENRIAYLGSLYRSTLTVTGIFPGVYQYSASNRATATPSTASFNIEGTYIIMCSQWHWLLYEQGRRSLFIQYAYFHCHFLFCHRDFWLPECSSALLRLILAVRYIIIFLGRI
jgi:hypothetical protein